jgi:hypothetical protein
MDVVDSQIYTFSIISLSYAEIWGKQWLTTSTNHSLSPLCSASPPTSLCSCVIDLSGDSGAWNNSSRRLIITYSTGTCSHGWVIIQRPSCIESWPCKTQSSPDFLCFMPGAQVCALAYGIIIHMKLTRIDCDVIVNSPATIAWCGDPVIFVCMPLVPVDDRRWIARHLCWRAEQQVRSMGGSLTGFSIEVVVTGIVSSVRYASLCPTHGTCWRGW